MRKSSYAYEDLLASGHGQLFGEGFARLPLPNMLMVDRITSIAADGGAHGRGQLVAELDIHPGLWFFAAHFEGDPVMPGCLGLDALWQLIGFFMAWSGQKGRGRALGVGEVKFFGQVLPSSKLVTYEINIRRIITRKLSMGLADGRMLVDGREIYSATDLKVGMFTSMDAFSPVQGVA